MIPKLIHKEIYHNENLKLEGSCFTRTAVRAVISHNDKYLLVYSPDNGDYKFPGGGVETGESDKQALARELLEESGYRIAEIGSQIAHITEFSKSIEVEFDYFRMDSLYFLCTIVPGNRAELNLDDYEQDLNFQPVWISLDDAIATNKKVLNESFKPPRWTERETFFLEYLAKSDSISTESDTDT